MSKLAPAKRPSMNNYSLRKRLQNHRIHQHQEQQNHRIHKHQEPLLQNVKADRYGNIS